MGGSSSGPSEPSSSEADESEFEVRSGISSSELSPAASAAARSRRRMASIVARVSASGASAAPRERGGERLARGGSTRPLACAASARRCVSVTCQAARQYGHRRGPCCAQVSRIQDVWTRCSMCKQGQRKTSGDTGSATDSKQYTQSTTLSAPTPGGSTLRCWSADRAAAR